MTDADFARIKARFPKLRWHLTGCQASATRDGYLVEVWIDTGCSRWGWLLHSGHVSLARHPPKGQTLGRCLRSLECAILREARTLAAMVGKDVTP